MAPRNTVARLIGIAPRHFIYDQSPGMEDGMRLAVKMGLVIEPLTSASCEIKLFVVVVSSEGSKEFLSASCSARQERDGKT